MYGIVSLDIQANQISVAGIDLKLKKYLEMLNSIIEHYIYRFNRQ